MHNESGSPGVKLLTPCGPHYLTASNRNRKLPAFFSHKMQMNFNGLFINPFIALSFSGSMQPRKATLQVLSPATASQRSTSNQWTQSFSTEECPHATNGYGSADTHANHPSTKPASADGELFMVIDVYSRSPLAENIKTFSITPFLLFSLFFSFCSWENYNSLLASLPSSVPPFPQGTINFYAKQIFMCAIFSSFFSVFVFSSPEKIAVQTANRYAMPASNPYNPYFGPGLLPIIGHPEHAATALAANSSMPQAMSLAATNAGTQPQKRNVQVNGH